LGKNIAAIQNEVDSLKDLLNPKTSLFKVSVGARFDFLNPINETDLYYDINGFIPSIWKDHQSILKNIGFFATLNQTKLESDSGIITRTHYFLNEENLISVINSDSVTIVKNSYVRNFLNDNVEQFSLNIFPTYKLVDYLYSFIHIEGIYGKTRQTFSDLLIGTDTSQIHIDNYHDPRMSKNYFPYNSKNYTISSVSVFWGLGLFFNYDNDNLILRIKASSGINYNNSNYRTYYGDRIRYQSKAMFYYLNFNLIEKNTGIKLGGEIRGNFKLRQYTFIANSNYTLYLSKEFSLNKLAEFIKSK
jgi:hypothetical protein